jgi:hypothetical protein
MLLIRLLLIAAPLLSFINTVIICHSIGGEFRRNWKYLSLICLSAILLISTVYYEKIYVYWNIDLFTPLAIYWQVVFYPFLLFKRVRLKMLYSCILYVLSTAFIEAICTYTFLSGSIFSSLVVNALIDTVFGIFILGLLVLATKHMYTDATLKFAAVVPNYIFFLILLYLILVPLTMKYLVFSNDISSHLPSTVNNCLSIARLTFGIFSIIVIVAIYSLMFQTVANRKYEATTKVLKDEMENQIQHYNEINQVHHEMRAFRHDIKAQILCVRALVSANELEQAVDCLDKILGKAETSTKCFDTGNNIIDSLLSDKQQLAAQYHTNIVFSGCLPKEGFDLLDLCIITSNALDNAIEACAKDSSKNDKRILFESRFQQGYLVMSFQNPVFEKVDIIRDTVITTKTDKKNHGFGLYNMKEAVKKNTGDIKIFLRENNFCLEIALHCGDSQSRPLHSSHLASNLSQKG